MDVAVYLKELLLEKGDAGLPGLGNFSSQYKPAYFEETSGLFHPPHCDYFFNPEDDSLGIKLEKYIAEKENIAAGEAAAEISEYVKDCWYILNKGQRLQLMGVGLIYKDESGKLCFEADPLLVHGGDYYALGSIPAEKHILAPAVPPRVKKKFPLKTFLAVFMITAVVLGGLWVGKMVHIFQRKMELRGPLSDTVSPAKADADSLTDTSLIPAQNVATPDTSLQPAETEQQKTPPTPEPITVAKPEAVTQTDAETEGFAIIGGCFRSEEGAKKFNRQLIAKGFPSQVLGKTSSGLTMVSYSTHPDKASARKALEDIRQAGDTGAYIIKR
jgi:cell division septation protein DedD